MASFLPYIINTDESEHQISFETELAIAYLQSMNDDQPILDLVKAYYPFKVFKTEKGHRVFDLLGNNEGEVPLLVTNEINENIKGLAKAEEDKIKLIRKCKKLLKVYHNEPKDIKNLVDETEIVRYLIDSEKTTYNKTLILFQPIISEKKFYGVIKELEETRKNTEKILNSHVKAGKELQSIKDKTDKAYEKELKPVLKESDKILKSLIKEQGKEISKLGKEYKKVINDIIKAIDNQIGEKKAEYNKIIKEIYQEIDEKKRAQKHEQALNKLNKALEKLEKERKNKIESEKQKLMIKKKEFQKEFEQTKRIESRKQEKIEKKHSPLQIELDELLEMQNELILQLEEEEKALSTLINLVYVEGEDVLVPFYIHRKGNEFRSHPPTKTLAEKGSSLSLKNIVKYSLADKIRDHAITNTTVFDNCMLMVLDMLHSDSKQSQTYKKTIRELDLLDSRDNLVSLLIGLYRLYEWGWINDKEYFLAQTPVMSRIESQEKIDDSELHDVQPLEPVEQIA
jgi:hypothetical protein